MPRKSPYGYPYKLQIFLPGPVRDALARAVHLDHTTQQAYVVDLFTRVLAQRGLLDLAECPWSSQGASWLTSSSGATAVTS